MADEIAIVTSADDRFAVGLAGTMKSMLQSLSRERRVRLYVLDGGITDDHKDALQRHLADPRLVIEWLTIDRATVSSFVVSGHVSDATYYRLLSPEILPASLKKFIYLDSDMLIRRDIASLWDEPLDGFPCLAVQDMGAPYIDCDVALAHNHLVRRYLAKACSIPNYKDLGLDPAAPYFNGGVLVVDLEAWRREKLARTMLQVLHEHREHVTYWDQYALNVVLYGRWKALDPRWNQCSHVVRMPGWQETILSKQEYRRYTKEPWIAHFNWIKPWQADCVHPFAAEFLQHLAGCPWEQQAPLPCPARPYASFRNMREYMQVRSRRIRCAVKSLLSRRAA